MVQIDAKETFECSVCGGCFAKLFHRLQLEAVDGGYLRIPQVGVLFRNLRYYFVRRSMKKINLAEKFGRITDLWSPKIAAELNDSYLKLARFKGSFVWHQHANEDELFLVVKGNLLIKLRDGEIRLEPGECTVIPRGVEHLPVAEEEAHVLLIEPKSTLNTGDQKNDRTVEKLDWV